MTMQIIIGVLLLAALAYAWYTERTRRREAELERDLATRRTTLDGINKKLDEGKQAYEEAKSGFVGAPIPDYMFDHVGKPEPTEPRGNGKIASLVADVRSGRAIDPATGAVVEPSGGARPGTDAGSEGKTKITH